jgi:hypothetical protein
MQRMPAMNDKGTAPLQRSLTVTGIPENPKRDPESGSNTIKDPDDWTTGDERMTGAQASYLKTLSEEAGEPFDAEMTKAEASRRIDELQARTGRGR